MLYDGEGLSRWGVSGEGADPGRSPSLTPMARASACSRALRRSSATLDERSWPRNSGGGRDGADRLVLGGGGGGGGGGGAVRNGGQQEQRAGRPAARRIKSW